MLGIDTRAARYTWTALLVLLLLYLVYLMRTTLFAFVVALLFAYLLAPLVNIIDRFLPGDRSRTAALAIAYLFFMAAVFLLVTQVGGRVVEQATSLSKSMPGLLARMKSGNPNSLEAQIVQQVQVRLAGFSGDLVAFLPGATTKLLALAGDVVYAVVVPILAFFFLKDGRAMRDQVLAYIDDESRRALVQDVMSDINLLLAHYMRVILLLSLATFTAYSIFLTLVGVRFSILLAVMAGTLEYVPMFGPFAAGVIILVITGVTGGPLLGTLAFLLIYRLFQDYVLSPHLIGVGVRMHPLLVMFGVFAGAEIAGIPGAFLSAPVLALLRILYRRIRRADAVEDARLRLAPSP